MGISIALNTSSRKLSNWLLAPLWRSKPRREGYGIASVEPKAEFESPSRAIEFICASFWLINALFCTSSACTRGCAPTW